MKKKELLSQINSPQAADVFTELYGPGEVETERRRYTALVQTFLGGNFSDGRQAEERDEADLRVFSAPGRTELGGNHTDHNCGKVLAASVQLDNAAIVQAREDHTVFFRSVGHNDVVVHLTDSSGKPALEARPEERDKTEALIRGIAAELGRRGAAVGGFSANAASTVLTGSGLSSSAAVETLICRIFDCLYGEGRRSALEIAQIGQIAENEYFGKPCGLMDQAPCASGGAVAIDFARNTNAPGTQTSAPPVYPRLRQINFDLASVGYTLCVVNTRGSHSDLTPDYAAIPAEMKAVAAFFGKSALAELDRETVLSAAVDLRKAAGDRALLRAFHFFDENERVEQMATALDEMDKAKGAQEKQCGLNRYLQLVNESGDSSWELLQNVYPPSKLQTQGLSIALALCKDFFRRLKLPGACRVHGGGFAGTIQAYIPIDALPTYRTRMEAVFGPGSLTELRIRPKGAIELMF
jgi:galactokinase